MDRAVDTKALTKQILEGAEPRDVIATAVDEASVDEASTVTKKEVHGGKIVKRKHLKVHKHRILSAAQRKAIKKAQAASQKGTAKAKRKKSLNKRAAALEGEGEEVADENYTVDILCPACGANGMELLDTSDDEETAGVAIFTCPTCGKEFVLIDADEAESAEEEADEDEGEEQAEEGTEIGDEDPTTEEEKPEEVCGDEPKEEEDDKDEPLYFEPDDED